MEKNNNNNNNTYLFHLIPLPIKDITIIHMMIGI